MFTEDGREINNMCDVLDRAEARGEANKAIKISNALYKRGMPVDEIAEVVEASVEKVEKWLGLTGTERR